jgi:hypothetical protein
MQIQSSEEVVCQSIMNRFPNAELKESVVDGSKVFQISQLGNIVILIDRIGAEFHFPTRGRNTMKWSDILEGGPEQVADMIIRDMADAGFHVLSEQGKPIKKIQDQDWEIYFLPEM